MAKPHFGDCWVKLAKDNTISYRINYQMYIFSLPGFLFSISLPESTIKVFVLKPAPGNS